GMLALLRGLSDDLVFIDLTSLNPRALTPSALTPGPSPEPARAQGGERGDGGEHTPEIRIIPPVRSALEPLLRRDSGIDRAVFCGSLHLLGAVIPLLAPDYEGLEEFERLKEEDEGPVEDRR